jgi:hypothetical protein
VGPRAVLDTAKKSKFVPAFTSLSTLSFLTSAVDRGQWSPLRPGRCNPGERSPSTHWIGRWVGPSVGLELCGEE